MFIEQAEQPYDYAKFHAQGQAILDMWHEIALAGNAPSEQIAADLVYFKNILEPSRSKRPGNDVCRRTFDPVMIEST